MYVYIYILYVHFVWLLLFIYSFLIYFLAVLGLCCCAQAFSSCGERGATLHCGAGASHCGGFSCCGARALGVWASVVVACGLSSYGLWALEHRLSSCGARALLLRGMWDLPGPGLEPVPPALAGGFLTTAPPGKSMSGFFLLSIILKFIRIVAYFNSSFLLPSSIPLYGCSPICFFQHLSCFQFGAITNIAAMNIVYSLCVDIYFHFFGADT